MVRYERKNGEDKTTFRFALDSLTLPLITKALVEILVFHNIFLPHIRCACGKPGKGKKTVLKPWCLIKKTIDDKYVIRIVPIPEDIQQTKGTKTVGTSWKRLEFIKLQDEHTLHLSLSQVIPLTYGMQYLCKINNLPICGRCEGEFPDISREEMKALFPKLAHDESKGIAGIMKLMK